MNNICVESYETFVPNLKQALYPEISIVGENGVSNDGLVILHLQTYNSKWLFIWLGSAGVGTLTDDLTRTHAGNFDLAAKRAVDIGIYIKRFIAEHTAIAELAPHHEMLQPCELCVRFEQERKVLETSGK